MPSRRALEQNEFGLYLLLVSLAVFFLGSLMAYVLVRFAPPPDLPFGPQPPAAPAPLDLPPGLWFSTALLLVGSAALSRALHHVRREHQTLFRCYLLSGLGLGLAFIVLQTWSLWTLLEIHAATRPGQSRLYGLVFLLVMLHGLHVAAGLFSLGVVSVRGLQGRYDHEFNPGVKMCVIYWHFLDAVWLVMFGVFLTTG